MTLGSHYPWLLDQLIAFSRLERFPSSSTEVWREFPDSRARSELEISDFGSVRYRSSCDTIPWSYTISVSNGRRGLHVHVSGPYVTPFTGLTFNVPRSVLLAFSGPANGRLALHRNDNRLDNRYPQNLYYGSRIDNVRDRSRNRALREVVYCLGPDVFRPMIPFRFLTDQLYVRYSKINGKSTPIDQGQSWPEQEGLCLF